MMAARTRKVTLNENWRQKIQTSMLINRLNDHALDLLKKPMEATQITAALGLLKKVAPDLSVTTLQGDAEKPLAFSEIIGDKASSLLDKIK